MDPRPPNQPGDPLAGALPEVRNFSLVLGGPLYQIFRKAHLDDDVTSHVRRRVHVICGIVWLPLLLLCALKSILLGGIEIPFLHDVETHARFLVAFGMMLVLGPLTVFAPQILAAKRLGKREYGVFAADYVREFDRRWLRNPDHDAEPLPATGDIQSLADLDNACSIVKEIKAVPFSRDLFLQLVWATLIPFAPLVFTMIPLEELLDRMIKAVF